MLILGLIIEQTNYGKKLIDGGACILQDGQILFASAEERFSGIKHDGGYQEALRNALDYTNLMLNDFDAIVFSSCCESLRTIDCFQYAGKEVSADRLFSVSHHLSHAYSTYFCSPFEESIILVMDAGGNFLGDHGETEWWRCRREQLSYYIAQGNEIRLLGRDFEEPYEAGFGEVYRAFTHYLGWHSWTLSANTMAFAAFGSKRRDSNRFGALRIFDFHQGKLTSRITNEPRHPFRMIQRWARDQHFFALPKPRDPKEEIDPRQVDDRYSDLAAYVQIELEESLLKKVSYLVEKTGVYNLCIAGGVGLNCVANRKIIDETPIRHIFIQPAAGDDGQALGNALYGYHGIFGHDRTPTSFSVYLGREYDVSVESLLETHQDLRTLQRAGKIRIYTPENLTAEVARLISKDKVVAWYQGRSEYGPRALGNRSILADPRSKKSLKLCHQIKRHGELFRPFAPSIIREYTGDFFDFDGESPYMLLVAYAKHEIRELIPGVLHVDHSARLQTVRREENPLFYDLLLEFKKLTGLPILLNTSFNGRNEPIVENPLDALDCFFKYDLHCLAIDNILFEKTPDSVPIKTLTSVSPSRLTHLS